MNPTANQSTDRCQQNPCILCGEPGNLASMFPVEEIWDNLGHLCWFYICQNHQRTAKTEAQVTRKLREHNTNLNEGESTNGNGSLPF